jgi:predicted RNase H-like HicB family nuclease
MAQYVGILDGKGAVWGIRIPDVPGCHGGGETPEAALADAIGALREVAAHYADNNIAIPTPRSLDAVRRDREAAFDSRSETIVLVPLLLDRGRSVKANVSLDAGTLEAIDQEAERRGLTRSKFLASAALDKIGRVGESRRVRRTKTASSPPSRRSR